MMLVAGLIGAPFACADDSIVFCEDTRGCAANEACVSGVCTAMSDTRIERLYPLAVDRIVDLDAGKRQGKLNDAINTHLRRLLDLAGYFQVLSESQNPPEAVFESLRMTTIDFERWHRAGAWVVVKGSLRRGKKRQRILTLRAFLVEQAEVVPVKVDVQVLKSTGARALRWAVARWVDSLLVTLTGKAGTFSTRITFAKRMKKGGAKEIYVMDMDGAAERPITQNGGINMLPAWAPRNRIAYTSFRDHNPDLFIGKRKFSGHPQMNTGAAWHPTGRLCAITLSKDGNAEIYVLDGRTGRIKRRLTRNSAIDTSPTWSPKGKEIAFLSDRTTGRPQIFVMGARGGDVKRLPQVGGYNTSPSWSPVAPRIAYATMRGGERYDIFVIHRDTGRVQRLTERGSNEEPSYSPDGRYIAYTSMRSGRQGIWIMTADGQNKRRVSRHRGHYMTPAWERRWSTKR